MKQPWKGIAVVLAGICVVGLMLVAGVGLLFRAATKPPPQAKLEFTGDWRRFDTLGFEERALPPAKDVRKDYEAWKSSSTNELISRHYLATLGGVERQPGLWTRMIEARLCRRPAAATPDSLHPLRLGSATAALRNLTLTAFAQSRSDHRALGSARTASRRRAR